MTLMPDAPIIIHVIDDDASVRKALARVLGSAGYACKGHSSAEAFLGTPDRDAPGCAVIDVQLPGLSGFELQDHLMKEAAERQVVFLTGEGDVPGAVRAMRNGAIHYLTKPADPEALLDAVKSAVERDAENRRSRDASKAAMERLAKLTPREREVMDLVIKGLLNKQIAARLSIAEKTVKVHRGRVMQKTAARSVPELVRLSQSARAGEEPPEA